MLHTKNPTKALNAVGEAIDHTLAATMIKDFQEEFPTEKIGHYIGRDILDTILAQPGCVGIRFYNALNEAGIKTLVYIGVDANEKVITKYTCVNGKGEMVSEEGSVGDRTGGPQTGLWEEIVRILTGR